jgi:insulysin
MKVFHGQIETSPLDKRDYRHLTLNNGLECLLISDLLTEKCSACCDVAVGSMSDPGDVAGLAHFLEHSKLNDDCS